MTRVATVATIRCEIGRSHADLAGPLLRSVVHHHCALVDCDVDTVDALDDAVRELIIEVRRRGREIAEITSVPDPDRLDVRLTLGGSRELDDVVHDLVWTLVRSPVTRAARFHLDVDELGRVHLVHRFDRREP